MAAGAGEEIVDMGIHLNPFEMPRLNIINDDQDRHSSTYSFDNDETNFDEFITQQFNLITDDEINVVEGLPPLVVQETTSASSVQQSTRNLLSTGVELLSNSRASEASDLVNKSMISPQSKVILPNPVKLVTNNNKRFMNGQLQQQQQTHNNAFDELNADKFVEDIFEGFNLDDADISEGELWKSLGSFDEHALLNDNSELLATSNANTSVDTVSKTIRPITPKEEIIKNQSDEQLQYPDSTTGHNEYHGLGVIEVDVTTQIPGQLPKLKLKFDGHKFVPLNIADSSSNRIAFEKAFIKLKRNNKDLNENRVERKTEQNDLIVYRDKHCIQKTETPSPIVEAPILKRPRGRPPKGKSESNQSVQSQKPKGRPKKQHNQPPPPGQSQKCLEEILRKAKELQRQAEAVLHCDYTTNIKGELSWTSSVAAVPPPTARDLFTYKKKSQTEHQQHQQQQQFQENHEDEDDDEEQEVDGRSENDKAAKEEKQRDQQQRNNNYGKGDGVEDIEREFVNNRKRKSLSKIEDEEPSSTKVSTLLDDRPKEKRGRKRKKKYDDDEDFTEEALFDKTFNYVNKQNSINNEMLNKSTTIEENEEKVPLSLINFSNRKEVFNALPLASKAEEAYQNPFRREWNLQSSWSKNKYFFHPPVGLKTSHSFKEMADDDILDVQRTEDNQSEEKEEDDDKLCPLRVTIRLSREDVKTYMKSPDSDSSSSSLSSYSSSSSSSSSSSRNSVASDIVCDELPRKSKISSFVKETDSLSLKDDFQSVNMKREKTSEERSTNQESSMDFTEKVPQSKIKNRRKSLFMRSSDYEEWKSSTAVNHKLGRPQIRFPEFKHNENECTSCSSSCDEYSNYNFDGSVKMSPQSTTDSSDSRKGFRTREGYKNNVPERKPKKKCSGITNKDINMNHEELPEDSTYEEDIDFDDIDQQIYRATSIYKHYSKNRRRRHMAKQPQYMKYARYVLKFLEYYNRLQHEQRCN